VEGRRVGQRPPHAQIRKLSLHAQDFNRSSCRTIVSLPPVEVISLVAGRAQTTPRSAASASAAVNTTDEAAIALLPEKVWATALRQDGMIHEITGPDDEDLLPGRRADRSA
jgi:hypothetical protein